MYRFVVQLLVFVCLSTVLCSFRSSFIREWFCSYCLNLIVLLKVLCICIDLRWGNMVFVSTLDQLSFWLWTFRIRTIYGFVLLLLSFLLYVFDIDRLRIIMAFDPSEHLFSLCINTIYKPVFWIDLLFFFSFVSSINVISPVCFFVYKRSNYIIYLFDRFNDLSSPPVLIISMMI